MELNHSALDTVFVVYPVLYLLPAPRLHLVDSYTANIHESSLGQLVSASCCSVVYVCFAPRVVPFVMLPPHFHII